MTEPRHIPVLSICLSLFFLVSAPRAAQPPAPRGDSSRFIGVWDLISVEALWPDGRVTAPWGAHPPGRLIYSKDGNMSALLMHELRNQAKSGGVEAALQNEAAGYFGTYTVDPGRHIVSHHVAATLRHVESGVIDRAYAFRDGNLYLTAKSVREGMPVTYVLVWKRAGG